MTVAAPLVIGPSDEAAFARLRERASKHPVDVPALVENIKQRAGRRTHLAQMTKQTVRLDGGLWPFFITFSVEIGHPAGICRHLSMSIKREGRVPHPAAVELVMPYFGFVGDLADCTVWQEKLSDGGIAINVVQPVAMVRA